MFTQKPPPKGTHASVEHEVKLTSLADELQAAALALMADRSDRIALATGKELSLASVRARKVAADLGRAREDREHDEWLVAQAKAMGLDDRKRR